jgi:hypothetical protein
MKKWLSVLISVLVFPIGMLSQGTDEITASWSPSGDVAIITYQLSASREKSYDVNIVLRRESDKSFAVIPRSVSGDVGVGKFAAGVRQIRWNFKKDVPQGLTGDDYWFDITAREVVESGGSNWWIYAGGGAAVVAGVIVLVGGGSSGGSTPANGGNNSTLPDPPSVRPTP